MSIFDVTPGAGKTRSCAGWLALNLVVLAAFYGHVVLPEIEAKSVMEVKVVEYAAMVIRLNDENKYLRRTMRDTSCIYAMK